MLRKCKKLALAWVFSIAMLFSGCASHVDNSAQSFESLIRESALGVSFNVPKTVRESAVDYNTIINVPYFKQEKIDEAYLSLVNQTIVGTTETAYLLTSARDYVFTVVVADIAGNFDILSADRDEILDPCDISGFEALNYGRMIANADETPKAIMRLDFKLTDAMGTKNTYSGYYSLSNINGKWYCYLAGYKAPGGEAADKLKQCYNCVKSLA